MTLIIINEINRNNIALTRVNARNLTTNINSTNLIIGKFSNIRYDTSCLSNIISVIA